jgi:hypothetical protein
MIVDKSFEPPSHIRTPEMRKSPTPPPTPPPKILPGDSFEAAQSRSTRNEGLMDYQGRGMTPPQDYEMPDFNRPPRTQQDELFLPQDEELPILTHPGVPDWNKFSRADMTSAEHRIMNNELPLSTYERVQADKVTARPGLHDFDHQDLYKPSEEAERPRSSVSKWLKSHVVPNFMRDRPAQSDDAAIQSKSSGLSNRIHSFRDSITDTITGLRSQSTHNSAARYERESNYY